MLLSVIQISSGFFDFSRLTHVFELAIFLTQAEPRSRLGQRRALLFDRQLKLGRRDARQHLPLRHAVADIGHYFFDAAFGFGTDRHFIVSEKRADRFDRAPLLLTLNRNECDFHQRRCAGMLGRGFAGGVGARCASQCAGQDERHAHGQL